MFFLHSIPAWSASFLHDSHIWLWGFFTFLVALVHGVPLGSHHVLSSCPQSHGGLVAFELKIIIIILVRLSTFTKLYSYFKNYGWIGCAKGHLISKAIYAMLTSPKKQTGEFDLFAFLLFTANKSHLSVCFLGESAARQSAFWFYLTFSNFSIQQQYTCRLDTVYYMFMNNDWFLPWLRTIHILVHFELHFVQKSIANWAI